MERENLLTAMLNFVDGRWNEFVFESELKGMDIDKLEEELKNLEKELYG